jgi:NAD(P)-dependent dehydrogenase (short-subunit alcohol dehydrogenase family)
MSTWIIKNLRSGVNMRLKDKVAIVTGGGRGIGRAICVAFAREGAKVAVAARTKEEIEETARLANEAAKAEVAIAVPTDITSVSNIDNLAKATLDKWGKIDILVNNAGGPPMPGGVADISEEDWDRTMAVDLKGPFLCCQRVVPEMVKRGKGKIVNISSGAGVLAEKGLNAYGVAKGAMILFTKQLALDYGREGINANCICPGYISTQLTGLLMMSDKLRESIEAFFPIKRIGEPEEVAHCAVFLASDESDYITGEEIRVDGGALSGVAEMFGSTQRDIQEVIKKYGEF